jgi:hypothetical protein
MTTHSKKFETLTIERSARTWILQVDARPSDIVAVVIKNGQYAKLFQASTEMLEACKAVVHHWDKGDLSAAVRQCSDVIAKIEGRGV